MTRDRLLGIDIGTTSVKAVVCDGRGAILGQASQEYRTAYPQPTWAEQDPDDWWHAVCLVIPQALQAAESKPERIAGIGVSGQAPAAVAVDPAGAVLHPALIWLDRRSEPQSAWIRDQGIEPVVTALNGGRADPFFLAPKLMWLKEHAPEVYRRAHAVLQVNGFVVQRLTGVFCMDVSQAPLTSLYDAKAGVFSSTLADALGLDLELLPRVAGCAEVVGSVTTQAAQATGLIAGTPVVAGMCDGTAAAVEAGLLADGDAVEMTGHSTVLLVCSAVPYLGRELLPLVHGIPGRYLAVGALVASGAALRWFRDELGESERREAAIQGIDPFELLSRAAASSPPGANRLVFLPYLFGERSPIWDSAARGVFFGLSLDTRRADLIRAIMEGAAFGLRHNVEAAQAAGFTLTGLSCVGGGARSAVWNQIKADVLGLPVRVLRRSAGAPLGDALVAGVGCGMFADLREALSHVVETAHEYAPNPLNRERYDQFYRIYKRLYPALKASYDALAQTS